MLGALARDRMTTLDAELPHHRSRGPQLRTPAGKSELPGTKPLLGRRLGALIFEVLNCESVGDRIRRKPMAYRARLGLPVGQDYRA
jgi:hypothetical protein